MKKKYLLLFLCISLFSTHAQNKKELKASILILKSDSIAMSNTIEEKNRVIKKNTNEIEELNSLNKSNNSEIDNLKKIITENEKLIDNNEKLISHKNIKIDSLGRSLILMNDSLTSIIEANSINSESKWIRIDLMESLQGRWMDDCDLFGPETYNITIDENYICMGMECGYGGSIKEIAYDIYNGQYLIKFINDNDMAGDGLPGEFKFYHIKNKLSYRTSENDLITFNKCDF
tara:strand:+ start:77 stop:772 length:696 start_codon:yes stop_codon:yes gene_type:complete